MIMMISASGSFGRLAKLRHQSHATTEWRIPETAASRAYRIRNFGSAKSPLASINHFLQVLQVL